MGPATHRDVYWVLSQICFRKLEVCKPLNFRSLIFGFPPKIEACGRTLIRLGLERDVIDCHTHVIATFPGQNVLGGCHMSGLELFVPRIPVVSEPQGVWLATPHEGRAHRRESHWNQLRRRQDWSDLRPPPRSRAGPVFED